jgi:hypothetical protein
MTLAFRVCWGTMVVMLPDTAVEKWLVQRAIAVLAVHRANADSGIGLQHHALSCTG